MTNDSTRGCGEIGRHTRLRIWRRKAWGFESLRPHQQSFYAGAIHRHFTILKHHKNMATVTFVWLPVIAAEKLEPPPCAATLELNVNVVAAFTLV